jgi:hypothetical protein
MFRFTIRETAMLTAIVALALGWGLDHWSSEMRAKRSQVRFEEMVSEIRGEVLARVKAENAKSQKVSPLP